MVQHNNPISFVVIPGHAQDGPGDVDHGPPRGVLVKPAAKPQVPGHIQVLADVYCRVNSRLKDLAGIRSSDVLRVRTAIAEKEVGRVLWKRSNVSQCQRRRQTPFGILHLQHDDVVLIDAQQFCLQHELIRPRRC